MRRWGIIAGAALLAGCAATSREVVDRTGVLPSTAVPSKVTNENIMKLRSGIGSNKILEMFGEPKNVSQSGCGAGHGRPWTCTTWEYEEGSYDRASFTLLGTAAL